MDAPLPFTAHIAHIDYTLRAVTGQGSEQVTHRLYSQSPCIHTARKIKMAAPLYYMPKTTSREGLPELESHHIPYHLMAIWTVSVLVLVFSLRWAVLKITDMTDPKGPQRRLRKPGEKPGRWEDRGLERVWFWYYVLHIVSPSPYSVWEYGVGLVELCGLGNRLDADSNGRSEQGAGYRLSAGPSFALGCLVPDPVPDKVITFPHPIQSD